MKYYYSASDVTLNFSEFPDSSSQVCLESTYCGTPVVAFESGNIPYLSKEIENISIVDKNVSEIIKGINEALKMKYNDNLKCKVKNKIENKYSVNKIISDYMKLYKKYMEEY